MSTAKSRAIVRMVGEVPSAEAAADMNLAVEEKIDTLDGASMGDIPRMTDAEYEELGIDPSTVPQLEPPQPVKNAAAIEAMRLKFRRNENDCGSPEYQIATLTAKIAYLTEHLKKNRKDHASTRGLRKMVSTRTRLLKYIKKENKATFDYLISELGIRVSKTLRSV